MACLMRVVIVLMQVDFQFPIVGTAVKQTVSIIEDMCWFAANNHPTLPTWWKCNDVHGCPKSELTKYVDGIYEQKLYFTSLLHGRPSFYHLEHAGIGQYSVPSVSKTSSVCSILYSLFPTHSLLRTSQRRFTSLRHPSVLGITHIYLQVSVVLLTLSELLNTTIFFNIKYPGRSSNFWIHLHHELRTVAF